MRQSCRLSQRARSQAEPPLFPIEAGPIQHECEIRCEMGSWSQRGIMFTLGSVGEGSNVQYTLISCSIQHSWTQEQQLRLGTNNMQKNNLNH